MRLLRMSVSPVIYLDVCCLNRPFDDQTQDRVHMESEAVAAILGHVDRGDWVWVGSEALLLETARIKDEARKDKVLRLIAGASRSVGLTAASATRAAELVGMGFGAMDALHVACAESARADVLLTTDDRLENIGNRQAKALKVRICNPWRWLEEMTGQ